MTYYLAIDIGASSGRHILAWREGGEFQMKEIYRFPNMPKKQGEHLVWDIESLSEEVLRGIAVCSEMGITPKSVGIDTWGVDYVLLDERDAPILPATRRDFGEGTQNNTPRQALCLHGHAVSALQHRVSALLGQGGRQT